MWPTAPDKLGSMTWLVLIVRLRGAAPRYRRRVYAALADGGGVAVSGGVWAIPDTVMHRPAVDAAVRHALAGGGDIVVMATTTDNGASHEVFEVKLSERLTAEAEAITGRCTGLAAAAATGCGRGGLSTDLHALQRDVRRLARLDVIGLEVVASAEAAVARAGNLPAACECRV